MPKRSNEFQTLVTIIEKQLAPKGAKITESKLLRDRRTKQDREIDILIESEVGGHPVVIGIECTKRQNPVDIQWFEQLENKYRNLETSVHKVVLVSHSGFYQPVVEAAKFAGIDLLTFEEAVDADWVRTVASHDEIFISAVRFIPISGGFDAKLPPLQIKQLPLYVTTPDGKSVGEVLKYSMGLLYENPTFRDSVTQRLISKYDDKSQTFEGGNTLAQVDFAPDKEWWLQDRLGSKYRLLAFSFVFECKVERFCLRPQRFTYNQAQVATVTQKLPGLTVTITITESELREPTLGLVFEFEGNDGKTHKQDVVTAPLPKYTGTIHFLSYNIG